VPTELDGQRLLLVDTKEGSKMTLIYEYMAILFIAFLVLIGIFMIGVVLLAIGLVTRFLAKKKQQVKRFPKVLIGLSLPMLILPVVLVAIFVGGRIVDAANNPIQYQSEETLFNEKVDEFFEAADRKDAQAIYDLCAVSVQKENPALQEQIDAFLDEYPGYPEIFVEYDRKITEKQVRDFLAESTSLSKFKQQFGEPNSDDPNLVCFYEIEGSDGGQYYAKLYYDTDDNKIEDCSCIVDDIRDYYSPLFEETEE